MANELLERLRHHTSKGTPIEGIPFFKTDGEALKEAKARATASGRTYYVCEHMREDGEREGWTVEHEKPQRDNPWVDGIFFDVKP